jgi:hypothetical protein
VATKTGTGAADLSLTCATATSSATPNAIGGGVSITNSAGQVSTKNVQDFPLIASGRATGWRGVSSANSSETTTLYVICAP